MHMPVRQLLRKGTKTLSQKFTNISPVNLYDLREGGFQFNALFCTNTNVLKSLEIILVASHGIHSRCNVFNLTLVSRQTQSTNDALHIL